jgi:hypothetical protein
MTVVPERRGQALRPQSEQFALLRYAAEPMAAEGPNRNRTCSGDTSGHHAGATEHFAEGLHSADFIHCGADDLVYRGASGGLPARSAPCA